MNRKNIKVLTIRKFYFLLVALTLISGEALPVTKAIRVLHPPNQITALAVTHA